MLALVYRTQGSDSEQCIHACRSKSLGTWGICNHMCLDLHNIGHRDLIETVQEISQQHVYLVRYVGALWILHVPQFQSTSWPQDLVLQSHSPADSVSEWNMGPLDQLRYVWGDWGASFSSLGIKFPSRRWCQLEPLRTIIRTFQLIPEQEDPLMPQHAYLCCKAGRCSCLASDCSLWSPRGKHIKQLDQGIVSSKDLGFSLWYVLPQSIASFSDDSMVFGWTSSF